MGNSSAASDRVAFCCLMSCVPSPPSCAPCCGASSEGEPPRDASNRFVSGWISLCKAPFFKVVALGESCYVCTRIDVEVWHKMQHDDGSWHGMQHNDMYTYDIHIYYILHIYMHIIYIYIYLHT